MMININDCAYPHIEKIRNPSKTDFLEKYGLPGKPALVLGAMDDWRARSRWTPEFFTNQHGSTLVKVKRAVEKENGEPDDLMISMSEYIEYMQHTEDEDPYYLGGLPIEENFSELSEDYVLPEYFESWHVRLPDHIRPKWNFFYIGPANSNTGLHIEAMMSSSWNAVISGRKIWLFYPPEQGEFLYSGDVDAFNPELSRYPLFAHTCPLMCVQNPGEIVFTPSGWWHQVVNEQRCISIAGYFVNESNADQVNKFLVDSPASDTFKQLIWQYIPELNNNGENAVEYDPSQIQTND